MTERRGIFSFLVDVNPIAKLYKNILGVPDVIALQFADEDKKRAVSQEETSQTQVPKGSEEAVPLERPVRLSANERYSNADYARRYGDYEAAHEIEKGKRRNFKID